MFIFLLLLMLAASRRVLENFDNDEFEIFVITGKNGYGKTTYANRIIAEVYGVGNDTPHSIKTKKRWNGDGKYGNWNLDLFRTHLGYHPKEVHKIWNKKRKRDYCYHWDDAGVWLSAYDHHDPYVQSIAKYMQTARTDWGAILFSCIDKSDIISKLRNFKSAIIIDITKEGAYANSPFPSKRNNRTASAWHYWESRINKIGTENDWQESFDSHVPDDFYSWYNPKRKRYATLAKKQVAMKLKQKKDI